MSKKTEKTKKKKATKKVVAQKSEKTVAKKATKKTGVFDKFNRRLGTQGALIDEHLSESGKTIAQLAEETGLSNGRIATHVRDLTGKGFIKKDKDGKYSINMSSSQENIAKT